MNSKQKNITWKCYQIYFDRKSKKSLLPCFEHFDNSKDKSFYFFENNVILKIYKKLPEIKADYIGTCSWKFREKTGMNSDEFISLIEKEKGKYDVILFPHAKFIYKDCIQRNKIYYPVIYNLIKLFDQGNILPFKMLNTKWTSSYCNFWIAKKEVYKHYVETTLAPAMDSFFHNKTIKKYSETYNYIHNGKKYPVAPFILELLMGFYVNHFKKAHIIITPDLLKMQDDECLCEIINPNLVPEGKKNVIFKRKFAEELQVDGHVKIL